MSWGERTRVRLASAEKLKRSAARTSFPRTVEMVELPKSSGASSRRADGASPLKVLEVDALREEAAMQADSVEEQHEFDQRQVDR
jgi:hypothetical protein